MLNFSQFGRLVIALSLALYAMSAGATSFRVQCPMSTTLHPTPPLSAADNQNPIGGSIKCQQIGGGDGFATMADGNQIYLFAFGPLSGLGDMAAGQPGTEPAWVFDQVDPSSPQVGDPVDQSSTASPAPIKPGFFNGAVGLTQDPQVSTDPDCSASNPKPPSYCNPSSPYYGLDGFVDPRPIMDVGVMNGNEPAPTMAIDEDDEFFLTLTNVGMIMRPDLFEQHTVHFHGYPNASAFYDGVPDPSVAINIGGSMTYYYLAPDAGTYIWHCHITPPEHLQMGMVGQIYVRPRQDRVPAGGNLYTDTTVGVLAQQKDPRTACYPQGDTNHTDPDILCSAPLPAVVPASDIHANNLSGQPTHYTYNDGDGSTAYDVDYPIQMHGFDPNFHFVGMTFNPEPFTDMKDKYFLLNGRSYPDTVSPANYISGWTPYGPMTTQSTDGTQHDSQPLPSLINIPVGGKALLRISDLDVTEEDTLASLGIPMHVIGYNAKLLRDQAGNNMDYYTNSITLGGGESADIILDASDTTKYQVGQTFYIYSPNLDHLSNDAENFGGMMTEIHICNAVDPTTKACS
ncbi:MAG TPA: multicopper oxidase domain-containing protein [Parasulfuritortus sp.]